MDLNILSPKQAENSGVPVELWAAIAEIFRLRKIWSSIVELYP